MSAKEGMKGSIIYSFNVAAAIATIVYTLAWVSALNEKDGRERLPIPYLPKFSEAFVADGFCNGYTPVTKTATQHACFVLDLALAALLTWSIVNIFKKKWTSTFNLLMCGYLLIHGIAHQLIHTGVINTSDKTNDSPWTILLLAVMVCFGPIIFALFLLEKKIPKIMAISVAIIAEFLTVMLYLKYIQYGIWALTYINISIFFWTFLPLAFLFSKDDPQLLTIYGSSWQWSLLTLTLMYIEIFSEATLCIEGADNFGGHVWFDVFLFLVMLVVFIDDAKKKEKLFEMNKKSNNEHTTKIDLMVG